MSIAINTAVKALDLLFILIHPVSKNTMNIRFEILCFDNTIIFYHIIAFFARCICIFPIIYPVIFQLLIEADTTDLSFTFRQCRAIL